MRWAVAAVIGLTAAPAGAAQQRTADDYVCLLSGDCAAPAVPPAAAPPAATGRFKLATAPTSTSTEMTATDTSNSFALATVPRPVDLRLSFASGSATLTPSAQAEARTIAAALVRPQLAGRRLRIEGHTDSVGTRASNRALSQRRADALAAYIAGRGVARTRLVAVGYGFDRPLAGKSARDPANRRVVAVLTP